MQRQMQKEAAELN
jgi:hypothetical protein